MDASLETPPPRSRVAIPGFASGTGPGAWRLMEGLHMKHFVATSPAGEQWLIAARSLPAAIRKWPGRAPLSISPLNGDRALAAALRAAGQVCRPGCDFTWKDTRR